MNRQDAVEQYEKALKEGMREYRECIQKKVSPSPIVLDDILEPEAAETSINVGLVDIPIDRIVGVKNAGRISAFTPTFRPLMELETEFASKWVSLCADHLGEEGIRTPIECFEYLGNFYVQEGNKRVSVLRHFGAARIPGTVKRIQPVMDDSPRMKAYQEFIEFFKLTRMYDVQYVVPGNYGKLLDKIDFSKEEKWSEDDRRRFRASFYYFKEAMNAVGGNAQVLPEDALLLWLDVYPFSDLKKLSTSQLKKTITQMWPNLVAASAAEPLVKTEPPEEKGRIVQLFKGVDHLKVAFVHQYSWEISPWTWSHDAGRQHLEKVFGKAVTTKAYFNIGSPEKAEEQIDKAVAEGAEVVFTTATQLIGACMRASVKYPKVRFLNCSIHHSYASLRTYYGRIHEGKFITGAIAGAMCKDDRIGYIGNYPIYGEPASINAFALGAQLTNPNAKIELKWSCVEGNPTKEFLNDGIHVISNRNTPVAKQLMNEFGTYMADDNGEMISLGSPTWVWDQFYENIVRSIMSGSWESDKEGQIMSLWWGMSSGVIDVALSDKLPEGIRVLAEMLKKGIVSGELDPFKRKILDQQGNVRNDGTKIFTPAELMHMDWLCENVVGGFPKYDEIQPIARPMVDILGVSHSLNEAGRK